VVRVGGGWGGEKEDYHKRKKNMVVSSNMLIISNCYPRSQKGRHVYILESNYKIVSVVENVCNPIRGNQMRSLDFLVVVDMDN
jgi:hypothetical protein